MRPDVASDCSSADEYGIRPIEILCVNLYPFAKTVEADHTITQAVENIDIGGPAMLRSAAKNHQYVTAVTNPVQYEQVLAELRQFGGVQENTRKKFAVLAFLHTAHYDSLISLYFHRAYGMTGMPCEMGLPMRMVAPLRYGENPHQTAAFYADPVSTGGLPEAVQLQGKELSFCNLNDADTAIRLAMEFAEPVAVAVKHATPCGVAIGMNVLDAYKKAYEADPVSIFGGIVAVNRPVEADLATEMTELFLDVILAPGFSAEAREVFAKKKNLRILEIVPKERRDSLPDWDIKRVLGGYLLQSPDIVADSSSWEVVTGRQPTSSEWRDLKFAWTVVKYVKSNAVVIARDGVSVGIGTGQTNRRDATLQALIGAGERARGAVLASDAFFPMPDSVEFAMKAGVTAVIHPGGSLRDADTLSVAQDGGLAMVLTGERHFRH